MGDYKVIMQSGNEYPISKEQRDFILQKSKLVGGNYPYFELKETGAVLFYKHISEFVLDEYVEPEKEQPKSVEPQVATPTEDSDDAEIEARRAEALKDLMEKSSCKHENKVIHFIETKSSKGKVTRRYFPVCEFCGQRFKFVKADDLADDVKDDAVEWVDTE